MSGRETVHWVTGVPIRLALPPIPIPFLPLTRPSLELEERRTESHPGRSSVPLEVFLPALLPAGKLGLGLGGEGRGSEGGMRAKDLQLAVKALGDKGRRGEWRLGGVGAKFLERIPEASARARAWGNNVGASEVPAQTPLAHRSSCLSSSCCSCYRAFHIPFPPVRSPEWPARWK